MTTVPNTNLPFTARVFSALGKREPALEGRHRFGSCKGRTVALLNTLAFTYQLFIDPFYFLCRAIVHLFKMIIKLSTHKKGQKNLIAKKESFKILDSFIIILSSPFTNTALLAKSFCGIINPKVCYKQASETEGAIIKQYHCLKKSSNKVSQKAVKDATQLKFKDKTAEALKSIAQDSKAIRHKYSEIKYYPI